MTTTRFQDLEQQIQTLQEEIDRLKKEEQETKLPKDFNRELVIKFLNTLNSNYLEKAFFWWDTPQGINYWDRIYYLSLSDLRSYTVPEEAIIQLQKWVIQSYQQQYGN